MAKIDKSPYSKEAWRKLKQERRIEKLIKQNQQDKIPSLNTKKMAFVLGNGTSRAAVNPEDLPQYGKVYGCNALYRTFRPDYLIAVDVKMILEINKSKYQYENEVWTNPNKSYSGLKNLNFFNPNKGWSSGPTALWLASQHYYERIFILGFDFKGIDNGNRFNNIYADTMNYKKSSEGATFFGNWMRQTTSVIRDNPNIHYTRVIASDNYCPEELNKFSNYSTMFIEDFQKMFSLL